MRLSPCARTMQIASDCMLGFWPRMSFRARTSRAADAAGHNLATKTPPRSPESGVSAGRWRAPNWTVLEKMSAGRRACAASECPSREASTCRLSERRQPVTMGSCEWAHKPFLARCSVCRGHDEALWPGETSLRMEVVGLRTGYASLHAGKDTPRLLHDPSPPQEELHRSRWR
jgi:hypothetical protein